MTPEERKLLQETYDISLENNKMLHKLHRSIWWGRVWRLVYWGVILAGGVGVYVYLQPVLLGLLGSYEEALSGIDSLKSTSEQIKGSMPSNLGNTQDLIKQLQGMLGGGTSN